MLFRSDYDPNEWIRDKSKVERYRKYFIWNSPRNKKIKWNFIKFINDKYKNTVITRSIDSFEICDPVSEKPLRIFAKIPFTKTNKFNIKVDVVFSNRMYKHGLLKDSRSFQEWPKVIDYFKSKGLTVGGIGKKGLAYENFGIINNFDYENPNLASLEMLRSAKYYIGTDTGVTHLASNFPNLKMLLFRINDSSKNWIKYYDGEENVKIVHEMSQNVEAFNDYKILCKNADEFFFTNSL